MFFEENTHTAEDALRFFAQVTLPEYKRDLMMKEASWGIKINKDTGEVLESDHPDIKVGSTYKGIPETGTPAQNRAPTEINKKQIEELAREESALSKFKNLSRGKRIALGAAGGAGVTLAGYGLYKYLQNRKNQRKATMEKKAVDMAFAIPGLMGLGAAGTAGYMGMKEARGKGRIEALEEIDSSDKRGRELAKEKVDRDTLLRQHLLLRLQAAVQVTSLEHMFLRSLYREKDGRV